MCNCLDSKNICPVAIIDVTGATVPSGNGGRARLSSLAKSLCFLNIFTATSRCPIEALNTTPLYPSPSLRASGPSEAMKEKSWLQRKLQQPSIERASGWIPVSHQGAWEHQKMAQIFKLRTNMNFKPQCELSFRQTQSAANNIKEIGCCRL